ncbi:MAG: stage III sporulation protein AE [Oscillospiraceae bacterium]|nr:stage III sporulation protein AE [Oscillospiraceae bacterium]
MRKLMMLAVIIVVLIVPVSAMEFTAPEAPDAAEELMPAEIESFGQGLWKVFCSAVETLQPKLADACGVCVSLTAIVILVSVVQGLSEKNAGILELVAALGIGGILLYRTGSLINLGAQTVTELSEYGKLLLPVMTAALAAQGGGTASAALYGGTAAFDALLGSAVSGLLVPMCYTYLILSVANSAVGNELLQKLRDLLKWLATWFLKIVLYSFTGYMGITGVVSGTADAAALKVTKMAISGMVPVVGGLMSDASESVLVSAGLLKNAAGIYGIVALVAIWIAPFLQIGLQYLLLKATGALCAAFGSKRAAELIQDFSSAMGLLLAMTGTVCILLLISTVCFMKGVG